MNVSRSLLENAAVVLKKPKYPGNIGAAARSCHNMGINKLVVVSDKSPDGEEMAKMATHNAAHILESMEIHAELPEALAPFSFVVGTTARLGRKRTVLQTTESHFFSDLKTVDSPTTI